MPYIVLDIETVPDKELWQPVPKPRSKKKPEEMVPPPYASRPVVIGFAYIDDNLAVTGMNSIADDNEARLIATVTDWIGQVDATLVTFNGRRFDLPVLALRALRHGLSQRFNTAQHRKRYAEDRHLDLFDVLTEYGSLGMDGFNLSALSAVIGLPAKSETGAQVEKLYDEKQIDRLRGYNLCDIARQSFLLFRYLLMRGRVDIDSYRLAASALFDHCVKTGLQGVTFGADPKRLLLQQEDAPPVAAAAS